MLPRKVFLQNFTQNINYLGDVQQLLSTLKRKKIKLLSLLNHIKIAKKSKNAFLKHLTNLNRNINEVHCKETHWLTFYSLLKIQSLSNEVDKRTKLYLKSFIEIYARLDFFIHMESQCTAVKVYIYWRNQKEKMII